MLKPWIAEHVTKLLGFEDDIVIEFIFAQLQDEAVSCLRACAIVAHVVHLH